MKTVDELDHKLSAPSERLVNDIAGLEGDIIILGAGGKMGPSLSMLAKRALEEAGSDGNVIGVSRFTNKKTKNSLKIRILKP